MGLWTHRKFHQFTSICVLAGNSWVSAFAWDSGNPSQGRSTVHSHSSSAPTEGHEPIHLPYAQFHIPFNLDQGGHQPSSVHLYVSTDQGATWQLHGRSSPSAKQFDFRAAAEGEYLFTVHTLDSTGASFPSPSPPLRVLVDTTKPIATLQADLDHNGSLIVDLRVWEPNLDLQSALLKVRTDQDAHWREIAIEHLSLVGDHFEGQVELILPTCREVLMILSVKDKAKNATEASYRYSMPRTAAGHNELQLASTRPGVNLPGAVPWEPDSEQQLLDNVNQATIPQASAKPQASASTRAGRPAASNSEGVYATAPIQNSPIGPSTGLGRLAGSQATLQEPTPQGSILNYSTVEELPAPELVETTRPDLQNEVVLESSTAMADPSAGALSNADAYQELESNDSVFTEQFGPQNPYYCKSRAFSLDYSADALGGNSLSEVELWGTEDSGQTWQKWGTDPDRTSPFDVRVGNDGLFGFRMVLVGRNGLVAGQPKPGEPADVWIHVDTELPTCKITRAVYGDGSEKGMLVIDYTCIDPQLADEPISLSYSTKREGPWTEFASGLRNTGLYLWKVDSSVPSQVFLKLEAVDKAGNTATHSMELPIDIRGLSPRGRIQGFRPILESN